MTSTTFRLYAGAPVQPSPARVAYLVSIYPAVSHTFIAREIEALRARGVTIDTFSVRKPREDQLLTEADRRAAVETPSIQPPSFGLLARAHLFALRRSPVRYLRTLFLALRSSPGGGRMLLWHLFYFAEAGIVAYWMAERGVRHLHVHFANSASMIACLAAELGSDQGVTWSFTMHGPTEFDDVTRYRLAQKVRSAAFVVCISDYARSQLMKLVLRELWGKLRIVHCGIDPDVFAPRPARNGAGPDRELQILCVGRLVPDKGQSLLLEALAGIRTRGHSARLTLVGDGPDRLALERRTAELGVSDAVTFAGAVGQDRIRDFYAAADVFCLPSFAEGVPVVLMEAMATGVPVLTTRIMGIPELVDDGVSGFLVPPGRSDAVVDVLERLARADEPLSALGAAARQKVLQEFNVHRSAEQLKELFETPTRL